MLTTPTLVHTHLSFLLTTHTYTVFNFHLYRYPEEFDRTSSHHLRSSDDMQYGFSYFYYVIGEKKSMTLHDVFIQLDTDLSG